MIIGISGKKQSGKNTVADILSYLYYSKLNGWEISFLDLITVCRKTELTEILSMYQYAIAEPLKEIVCVLTGCELSDLENESFKNSNIPEGIFPKKTPTYRQLMQYLGTDIFRKNIHYDFWINLTISKVLKESFCIITDVRFPNEANAILQNKGGVIRVERDNLDSDDCHFSETALDTFDSFDYVIKNNGTLEDLYNQVVDFVKESKIF